MDQNKNTKWGTNSFQSWKSEWNIPKRITVANWLMNESIILTYQFDSDFGDVVG